MVHMAFEEMKLDPPVSTEGDGRPWWMDHLKEESEKDQSGVQGRVYQNSSISFIDSFSSHAQIFAIE